MGKLYHLSVNGVHVRTIAASGPKVAAETLTNWAAKQGVPLDQYPHRITKCHHNGTVRGQGKVA